MLDLDVNTHRPALNSQQLKSQKSDIHEKYLNQFLSNLPGQFFPTAFSSFFRIRNCPMDNFPHVYKWPSDQHVDETNVNEFEILKRLSEVICDSKNIRDLPEGKRFNAYEKIMLGAYKGDHLLLKDDEGHSLTETLKGCGAIIRGSSHNEKGREIVSWNEKGGPVFGSELRSSLLKSDVKHYGITGNHIKHILFFSADMLKTKDGKVIAAITSRELKNRIVASKEDFVEVHGQQIKISEIDMDKTHHYVAFQFEGSPDSEGNNMKDLLFWKHRLAGFVQYNFIKKVNKFLNKILSNPVNIKANVGPYGYGRTDQHPVILE